MIISDALIEEIFQTLVQMQSLILLQHKTIASVIAKMQSEATQQQQRQEAAINDTRLDADIRRRHNEQINNAAAD